MLVVAMNFLELYKLVQGANVMINDIKYIIT
jgi:hypothetical protein